ncbi:hypothetical protein ABIA33_007721, partial [Streptacidiphilus sp. MAP12-16]
SYLPLKKSGALVGVTWSEGWCGLLVAATV